MIRSLRLLAVVLLIQAGGALAIDQEVHWDYEGKDGPETWGKLHPDFDMCARGRNQSPIDLVADIDAELPMLIFDYTKPGILREIDTGHATLVWCRLARFADRVSGPGNGV